MALHSGEHIFYSFSFIHSSYFSKIMSLSLAFVEHVVSIQVPSRNLHKFKFFHTLAGNNLQAQSIEALNLRKLATKVAWVLHTWQNIIKNSIVFDPYCSSVYNYNDIIPSNILT